MKADYFNKIVYLALAGTLFAGYLSFKKLITNVCAFNEGCPYFLGYPACWFGFGLFLIILAMSLVGLFKKNKGETMRRFVILFSLLGILFAGRFVIQEIIQYFNNSSASYALILPTCAYGLIFYMIIFVISLRANKQ